MSDDHISKLSEFFMSFPGIGPRQARRFTYHLLGKDDTYIQEFIRLVKETKNLSQQCTLCRRHYVPHHENEKTGTCRLCIDSGKDDSLLLIVEKDADLENINRTGTYNGRFFVLGGTLSVLEKEPERKIRIRSLEKTLPERKNLSEIIIALSATSEGDTTADYVKKRLSPIAQKRSITISVLGRGLSTGTELEYSDADTLRHALKHRE